MSIRRCMSFLWANNALQRDALAPPRRGSFAPLSAGVRCDAMRLPIDSLIIPALAVAWLFMQPGPEAGIALIASISALIYRWRKNKTEVVYDFTYPTEDALKFYSAIAEGYDSRNSPSLQKSHLCTLEKIESFLGQKNNWSVLDLGGGTGKLIALHFFNNPQWHLGRR